MFFFKALYNSLWNFAWLKSMRNATGKAIGYFSLLILLLAVSSAIPVAIALPKVGENLKTEINKLPPFEATLKNGELTVTGIDQPFVHRDKNRELFVLDTTTSSILSLGQFMTSTDTSGVLITKTKVEMFNKDSNQEVIYGWKNLPEITINKDQAIAAVVKYTSAMVVALGSLLSVVIFFVVTFISKLWSIFVVAFVTWGVSGLLKRGWKFGELFTVGFFAVTLPTLLSVTLTLFGVFIPLIHFMALLAFMLAVVLTKDEKEMIDTTGISV